MKNAAEVIPFDRRSDAEVGLYKPLIPCRGCDKWTRHQFAQDRAEMSVTGGVKHVDVMYRCLTCERERIYGGR